jgi:hypothetical protein
MQNKRVPKRVKNNYVSIKQFYKYLYKIKTQTIPKSNNKYIERQMYNLLICIKKVTVYWCSAR